MNRNDAVAVDPSFIDTLNESITPSPEDTLIAAESLAEDEGIDRDYAFDHFVTIN